jgi:hypothetical protein
LFTVTKKKHLHSYTSPNRYWKNSFLTRHLTLFIVSYHYFFLNFITVLWHVTKRKFTHSSTVIKPKHMHSYTSPNEYLAMRSIQSSRVVGISSGWKLELSFVLGIEPVGSGLSRQDLELSGY